MSNNPQQRLRRGQVLMVLDNVSRSEDVTTLLGPLSRTFKSGSQLLIFSRIAGIVNARTLAMPVLSSGDAAQLFNRTLRSHGAPIPAAIEQMQPEVQGLMSRAQQLLTFQSPPEQHPLAITVLAGALAFRPVLAWQQILDSFQHSPLQPESAEHQVMDRLQNSYAQMRRPLQRLFLDIVLVVPRAIETQADIIEWYSMLYGGQVWRHSEDASAPAECVLALSAMVAGSNSRLHRQTSTVCS